jgi:diguanylate cyclase (GGDEF)-like protein
MADSATEALAMIKQKSADVILADWMMPEMDGLELTSLIRQRDEENGTYTAIILFTAHEGMDYLVKAFAHGVDDYICKPPNPLELAARVNAAARIAILQNDLLETSRQMQHTIQNLKKMALVDELTGAGNQQFLVKNLKSHLLEASTRRGGVCLAMVELRELPDIKVHYGNIIADEILVSLHRRLRRAVRPTDFIAHMDNNSFAIIMHHTNLDDYKPAAVERILTMINYRDFKTSAGNLNLSGCIGVNYYRGDEAKITVAEMLNLAGKRLNKARNDQSINVAY